MRRVKFETKQGTSFFPLYRAPESFPLKLIGKDRHFRDPGFDYNWMPLEPVHHFTADELLLRQANAEDFRKKKLYENHPYEEPAAIFYSGHRLPSTTTSGAGSG